MNIKRIVTTEKIQNCYLTIFEMAKNRYHVSFFKDDPAKVNWRNYHETIKFFAGNAHSEMYLHRYKFETYKQAYQRFSEMKNLLQSGKVQIQINQN